MLRYFAVALPYAAHYQHAILGGVGGLVAWEMEMH
jgi:hypothetical protein